MAVAAAVDEVPLVTSSPVTRVRGRAARDAVEVRLEGLRRHYGSVVALDRLDLTLEPGQLIALLGPSGCGKTTTLRLLAGLEDADAGRIIVGGRDMTHIPANKRDMGMVFQAYSLFPHMTVRQNVAFGLRLRRVGAAERDQRALEMLELVGLAEHATRCHSGDAAVKDVQVTPADAAQVYVDKHLIVAKCWHRPALWADAAISPEHHCGHLGVFAASIDFGRFHLLSVIGHRGFS